MPRETARTIAIYIYIWKYSSSLTCDFMSPPHVSLTNTHNSLRAPIIKIEKDIFVMRWLKSNITRDKVYILAPNDYYKYIYFVAIIRFSQVPKDKGKNSIYCNDRNWRQEKLAITMTTGYVTHMAPLNKIEEILGIYKCGPWGHHMTL